MKQKLKLTHSPVLGFILGFIFGILTSGNLFMAAVTGFLGAYIQMMLLAKPRVYGNGESKEGFLKAEQDLLKQVIALVAHVIRSGENGGLQQQAFFEARLRKEFSAQFVPVAMSHLRAELSRPTPLRNHTERIAFEFDNTGKIQLMHLLISICTVDGTLSKNELAALREISSGIEFSGRSLDAVLGMFKYRGEQQQSTGRMSSASELDNAYKTLGVSPSSSDADIKRAYKKLAVENHPDKFAHMGDHAQKTAAEKFKRIAAAYDLVCKKRGIV